ncbi:GIY-YIG nuclease family protein [Agromyces archimandritae]|uniref:GIY-YIG nuclease family protein n=1 Tax=Agromyces archimandritae TaxID=2781962 RepID=A0A975FL26_9MICO|nr:GIY-YIG nuclease family protein [Agromyces archimandritae]QTX04060.1 GIY-YIG nuclease family protein [Agromyces archimandritae]
MPTVYILECADGSYYVGSTRDLERRLAEHRSGVGAAYTRRRLPVRLAFRQDFDRIDEAYRLEKQVQGWSRRKREALIAGDYALLPALARKPRLAPPTSPPVEERAPLSPPVE